MNYFANGSPESWEEEYAQRVNQSLGELSEKRRLIILLGIGLVTAIELSNRMSINVLLPDLQGNVAGSSDDVSWVIILYNLGFLCSMAISYWMLRVLGARRHLLLSIALYATGAIGCFSSAHSLTSLLISRVIMGFGGGAFLVRTLILVRLMFPGKARIFAITWLYLELYLFAIVYPTAVGWISDTLRWNYAFLLDFPFLALGAYLIWKYAPRGHLYLPSEKDYIDAWGAGLLIIALGSMQIALSRGERDLWFQSPFIVCFLLVALVCFAGFLWWDWRPDNPAPVLNLRTIWRATFITSLRSDRSYCRRDVGRGSVRPASISADRAGLQRNSDWRFHFCVLGGAWNRPDDFIALRSAASLADAERSRSRCRDDVRCQYQLHLYLDAHHSNLASRAVDLSARDVAGTPAVGRLHCCDR